MPRVRNGNRNKSNKTKEERKAKEDEKAGPVEQRKMITLSPSQLAMGGDVDFDGYQVSAFQYVHIK